MYYLLIIAGGLMTMDTSVHNCSHRTKTVPVGRKNSCLESIMASRRKKPRCSAQAAAKAGLMDPDAKEYCRSRMGDRCVQPSLG